MKLAILAATAVTSDAFYWITPPGMSSYELWYDYYEPPREPAAPSPYWTASADAYELKMRLPELEPQSITAALAADGTKIEVVGERKIDGCTCQPTTVKEVKLPYRPRPDDIDVSIGSSGVLSLRLARNKSDKADGSTPLAVKVLEASPAPSADNKDEAQSEPGTRPLRFVPHSSATDTPLEQQEKSLTDKFRSAALASVAVQRQTESANESTAASNEPQGVPPPNEHLGEGETSKA